MRGLLKITNVFMNLCQIVVLGKIGNIEPIFPHIS